jgi:hypothetical protein
MLNVDVTVEEQDIMAKLVINLKNVIHLARMVEI